MCGSARKKSIIRVSHIFGNNWYSCVCVYIYIYIYIYMRARACKDFKTWPRGARIFYGKKELCGGNHQVKGAKLKFELGN